MSKYKKKYPQAFTLIEVMVVVAIIGITTSIMLLSFSNAQIKRQLETNAREFVGALREAQNYALTGKQAVVGTKPCAFDVSWDDSAGVSTYVLKYRYRDNVTSVCDQTFTMASHVLKNGVVFSSSGTYSFDLPHANITYNGASFSGIQTSIDLRKQSFDHYVCVYSSGNILDSTDLWCS